MSGRTVRLVYAKELRETLRDRRTLAVMILLPLVLYPLISLMAANALAERTTQAETRPSRVSVTGTPPTAADVQKLLGTDAKRFQLVSGGREQDVLTGSLDALVVTGRGATEPKAAQVTVLFDQTSETSRLARERLEQVVSSALPPGCAPRFAFAERSLAAREKVGGFVLSKVLPSLLLLMVLMGAVYPAIDLTAGERERGTLETTLAAPIDTVDLMAGKVLAAATVASLTGVLNLAAVSVTVAQGLHLAAAGENLVIPWTRALATLMVVAPASVLFSAMLVAVGSLARSFKEAQTLLTPVYLLFIMPVVVASLVEAPLRGAAALIPSMNLALLMRDVVAGTVTASGAVTVLISTAAYTAGALILAARLYDPERLLSAEDARPWRRRRAAAALSTSTPPISAGAALTLFALSFVFSFFSAQSLQSRHLTAGLLISQWVGMFGLVWVYSRLNGCGLAETVRLRWPPGRAIVGAVLVGLSAWAALGVLSEWFLRPPRELEESLRRMIAPEAGRSLALTLALMSVTPAICEETLFRGALLRGLRTRLAPPAALVVSALLFGLAHFDAWRLIPTATLGLLFGWLALTSDSLVPSMIAHGLNNGALILLTRVGGEQAAQTAGRGTQIAVLVVSTGVLATGLALVHRARPAPAAPTSAGRD